MREEGEGEGMRRKEKQNERERENERGGQAHRARDSLTAGDGQSLVFGHLTEAFVEWPPLSADTSAFTVQGVLLSFLKPRPLLSAPCISFFFSQPLPGPKV